MYKHARLSQSNYEETTFYVGQIREGSFILDLVNRTTTGQQIVKKISDAIREPFQRTQAQGLIESVNLAERATGISRRVTDNPTTVKNYETGIHKIETALERTYGVRSIAKEIDQILSIIRSEMAGESYFELELISNQEILHTYNFNKESSISFHKTVTQRNLSHPLRYTGRLRSLDIKTLSGKYINSNTDKTSTIYIKDRVDFEKLKPHLANTVAIIACPIIEFGSYDTTSGDIFFITLA